MSTFIKKYKAKNGATVIQVIYKKGRQVVKTSHIGTAHTDEDLNLLIALAKEEIQGAQLALEFEEAIANAVPLEVIKTYPALLWSTLEYVYDALGFSDTGDEVFKKLVLARIIEPASKLDTIRILKDLDVDAPSNSAIHRCLKRIVELDYRKTLSACCVLHTTSQSLSLVLYDVTTLYFEIQKEDEYRIPGMSKERRLDPQILVGLLTDRYGFPLEVASFEGNRAEVKTIVEVLDTFKARYDMRNITVTADAAMLSSENAFALERAGYHYIIGSRLSKAPYEISEYINESGCELTDGQIFESVMYMNTKTGEPRAKRRVVYQYRKKRASLDLSNIEKALEKARRMQAGTAPYKKNRFLKVTTSKREINYELVKSARLRAGIKGYVTDLDIPAQEIIDAYHQLFQVERSFRMSKSDLKARPIFHHKRDSIEAHLTVVFAALAIAKTIQDATGITIKRFLQKLSPVRSAVINIDGSERIIKPRLEPEVRELIAKLESKCGS